MLHSQSDLLYFIHYRSPIASLLHPSSPPPLCQHFFFCAISPLPHLPVIFQYPFLYLFPPFLLCFSLRRLLTTDNNIYECISLYFIIAGCFCIFCNLFLNTCHITYINNVMLLHGNVIYINNTVPPGFHDFLIKMTLILRRHFLIFFEEFCAPLFCSFLYF